MILQGFKQGATVSKIGTGMESGSIPAHPSGPGIHFCKSEVGQLVQRQYPLLHLQHCDIISLCTANLLWWADLCQKYSMHMYRFLLVELLCFECCCLKEKQTEEC